MNADKLLDHLKPTGAYQRRLLGIIIVIAIANPWAPMSTVFTLYVPKHRCIFDAFGNASLSTANLSENGASDKQLACFTPSAIRNGSTSLETCTDWAFDAEHSGGATVVSEMKLVCHKSWIPPFILSMMMAARAIGAVVCGALADRFGRRPIYLCASAVLFASTVGMAFSPDVAAYGVFNAISGMASLIQYSAICIFGMEMVVPTLRNFVFLTLQTGYIIGYATLPLMAYLSHDWRILLYGISVGSTVSIIGYWYFPETIHWLLSKGNEDQVQRLAEKIAEFNNVSTSALEQLLPKSEEMKEKEEETSATVLVTVSVLLMDSKMRLRLFVATFIWLVTSFSYYAITFNTSFLPGDAYINCLISAVLELPCTICAFWLLDKIGRVKTSLILYVASGVMCASVAFIQNGPSISESIMAIAGKTALSGSFYTIYVHTAEIAPTMTRSLFMNICSASSCIGSIISPYIMYLGRSTGTEHVVYVAMGVACVFAGLLTLLFLPETAGKPLPDTMLQALNQEVIFHLPCNANEKRGRNDNESSPKYTILKSDDSD